MSTIIGTIHFSPIHRSRRSIVRTTGSLFSPGTLKWITAQAAHYATIEGDEAMRFAIGLAGLAYSSDATTA